MPDITRAALRERIARRLEDHVEGTADSATSSTLVDDALKLYPDDHFNNAWVYLNGGTGSGQERRITDYVQSTGTLTVSPNWSVTPDNTSTYEIHRAHRVETLNDAINTAIEDVRAEYQYAVVFNTSITVTDNYDEASYLYELPAGFREVWSVALESSTPGIYTEEIPHGHWEFELKTAATSSAEAEWNLRFDPRAFFPISGRKLKITGSQEQAALAADTDTLHAYLEPFVRNMALYWLSEPKARSGSPQAQAKDKETNRHYQIAERFRMNMAQTASPPGAVPVPR